MAKSQQLEGILGRATTATPKPAPTVPVPMAAVVTLQQPVVATSESKPEPVKAKPKPAPKVEPQKSVQAIIPASIERALKMKAAEEGTTVRNIILRGLKAVGFDVPDVELRDKRAKS